MLRTSVRSIASHREAAIAMHGDARRDVPRALGGACAIAGCSTPYTLDRLRVANEAVWSNM
jgi:hypothetical protein